MSPHSMSPAEPAVAATKQPRRYRGNTPDERREQRRRRLMAAALELFGTAGFQNTSVERLCSTAGVTGRHFYEEYSSREALLTALFDVIMDDGLAAVTTALAAAPARLDPRLRSGVGAYVHLLLDDPRRARIVTVEVVGVSRQLDDHRRAASRVFASIIEAEAHALREQGQQITGTDLTALALVAAVNELTAAWLVSTEPIAIADLIAEAVRIVTAVAITPA